MKKISVAFLLSLLGIGCWGSKYEDGMYAEFNTNKGKIVCVLYYEQVPMTVANFTGLAEGKLRSNKPAGTPFYDGLRFHRVVPDFMVQGGDPQGTGMGGPGYKFPDEFHKSLRHNTPGILSMANSGPNTNGSQFYITHKATAWLDNKHSVFGKVVEGMDVVNKIQQNDTLQSLKIICQGRAAKKFKNDQAALDGYLKDIADKKALEQKKLEEANKAAIQAKWPKAERKPSGLHYVIVKEGAGAMPVKGSLVSVHYNASLLDGKKIDSSRDRGTPFEIAIGVGRLIPGWDEGILDMKKGETRVLIVPPALAYGEAGAGNGMIPPNAFLVFEVELIDFKDAPPEVTPPVHPAH